MLFRHSPAEPKHTSGKQYFKSGFPEDNPSRTICGMNCLVRHTYAQSLARFEISVPRADFLARIKRLETPRRSPEAMVRCYERPLNEMS
jgi:hypothetical protein